MSSDELNSFTDIELDKAEREILEMPDALVKEKLHELQCSPFSKECLDVLFRENVPSSTDPIIKVVGVGGGGGNAVDHMISSNIMDVEYICANTDVQVLSKMGGNTIQLGSEITKGLGAGTNPDIGRQAAIENREQIARAIRGADMVLSLIHISEPTRPY